MTVAVDVYPKLLHDVIEAVKYKDGWSLSIIGFAGAARGLGVKVVTTNSLNGEVAIIGHQFAIPGNAHLWSREMCEEWVLRRLIDVETHEACEFFEIEGQRPYYPEHGPGATSLYRVMRRATG